MFNNLRQSVNVRLKDDAKREGGFTLVELLVVITILGILAAIVVFSVAGLGDKGQTQACKIDTRTLATAEEASVADDGLYVNEAGLVTAGLLDAQSIWHDIALITADPDGADNIAGNADDIPFDTYDVTEVGVCVGLG